MSELREKISKILSGAIPLTKYSEITNFGRKALTDKILGLFSDSIKEVQWVGECPDCKGNGEKYEMIAVDDYKDHICPQCNGTGKVTRQATIEEVW